MNNTILHVAKRGEGKTKWLLNVARKYQNIETPIYIVCDTEEEHNNFCNKYTMMYSEVCKVKPLTVSDNIENSIVLIDDIFEHDLETSVIRNIQSECKKLFITIEGCMEDSEDPTYSYEQLSLFDILNN